MTPEALLNALLAAFKAGDKEAAAFFPTFSRWYLAAHQEQPQEMRVQVGRSLNG